MDGINWHARLARLFDDLQEDATYTVRFRAKSDGPRRMVLQRQIDASHWHGIGLYRVVPLTADWQAYHYAFRAKNLAASNAIFFNLGDRAGTVWIADFMLTQGANERRG